MKSLLAIALLAVSFTSHGEVTLQQCKEAIAYSDWETVRSDERCIRYNAKVQEALQLKRAEEIRQQQSAGSDFAARMMMCGMGGSAFDSMCGRQTPRYVAPAPREPVRCESYYVGTHLYTDCR